MRRLVLLLAVLALALAACGGDDEGDGGGGERAATTTEDPTVETVPTETTPAESAETSTEAEAPSEPASAEEREAVRETIVGWLLEGDCDLMSDEFLEEQALVGDSRRERCKFFEDSFQKPQYGEDDIIVSDVKVGGDTATAVLSDRISNVEASYTLERHGDGWRIAAVDL